MINIKQYYIKRFHTDYANKLICIESGIVISEGVSFEDLFFKNYENLNAEACNIAFEQSKAQLIGKAFANAKPAQEVKNEQPAPEINEKAPVEAAPAPEPVKAPAKEKPAKAAKPKKEEQPVAAKEETAAPVVTPIPEQRDEVVCYDRSKNEHKILLAEILSEIDASWKSKDDLKAKAKKISEDLVGTPMYTNGELMKSFKESIKASWYK